MKKLLHLAFLILLSWALLETASFALFQRLTSRPFDLASLDATRLDRIQNLQEKLHGKGSGQVLYRLHPYLGYAGRPGLDPGDSPQLPFNEYGLQSPNPYPYVRKSPDEFVIAILGGSVANGIGMYGQEILQAHLRRISKHFEKTRLVLINLAIGGYKQPQQLFAFQYALLSGFKFDLVLNIDGFNDIVLSVQNAEQGINPIFPSGHHMAFLSKMNTLSMDPDTLATLHDLNEAREREIALLSFIQDSPCRLSPFANLLGLRWSVRNQAETDRAEASLVIESQSTMAEEFRGPQLRSDLGKYETAARAWVEASRMLDAICASYGIPYIHVLQPNQYYEGSKPLSPTEKLFAYRPAGIWGRIAARGYPVLVRQGEQLRESGIAYYDLTHVFENEKGDIYTDDCCHFGLKGGQIFLGRIAEILAHDFGDKTSVTGPSHEPQK